MDPNGRAHCWGDNVWGQITPPDTDFVVIAAGGFRTCGLDEKGKVHCWGKDENGLSTPPDTVFTTIAAGGSFASSWRHGVTGIGSAYGGGCSASRFLLGVKDAFRRC